MVPFEAASKHSNGGMIWEDVDPESAATHFLDNFGQPPRRALQYGH
jgi:hypothetical protein